MHPWILEQVASEHRRDLLALGAHTSTRRARRPWWPRLRIPVPRQRPAAEPVAEPTPAPLAGAGEARVHLRPVR